MPSPVATPRLSQPQHGASFTCGMSDEYSHSLRPFLASKAKISSLPVGMYITPPITRGSASNLNLLPLPEFRRVIHAPLRLATLLASIWVSEEYRSLLTAPP